jgi:hypothetical protein
MEGAMLFWMAASAAFALPELRVLRIHEHGNGQIVLVKNVGDQPSRGFYVDIWYHAPAAPEVGDFGDYYAWHPGLAPGQEYWVTVVPFDTWYDVRQGWTTGWIDVIVDTDRLVAEEHEGNNVTSAFVGYQGMWFSAYYESNGDLDYTQGAYQGPVYF